MKNKRVLIWVLALAAVAVLAAYYAGVAPAVVGADRTAEAFRAGLKGALGLNVTYRAASFRLLPTPAVSLRDAVITNAAGKNLVMAEEIRLSLSFFGFIPLRPTVAAVELKRPRGDFAPGDVSFGEEGKAPAFRGTLVVTDGFVRYAGDNRAAFIDGIDGKLRCTAQWGKELELRGRLAADRVTFGGVKEEKGGGMALAFEGKLRYVPAPPGGRLYLEPLDAVFDRARLTCRGVIGTGPGERDVDITMTGKRVALKQLLPALSPERFGDAEVEGELTVDLRAKGKWGGGARPSVRGTLAVDKAALRPAAGEGVSNVVVRVRFDGDKYVIESFQGQTKRGGFKGYGKVTSEPNWPFELNVEGVIPLEVWAMVLAVPPGYELGGPAQLALDVAGELAAPGKTSLDGTIELLGCQARVKPFTQPARNLTGTLYCDGFKLKAGKVRGRLGGDFELGGAWEGWETPRLDLVIVSNELDLDAMLPRGGAKTLKLAKDVTPAPGIPGRSHSAKGSVRFKKFKLLRVAGRDLEADFTLDAGVFNLTKLNFAAYDGKVQAQLTVYPGPRPRYTCSATISKARLGVFLTENKWMENMVTGEFSADVVFSAEGTTFDDVRRTLGGKGSLELAGGRVAKMPLLVELVKWSRIGLYDPLQISRVWTVVEAREGVVRSSELRLENPDLAATVAGEVTLDKKLNLTVKTSFPKKTADALARDGKALALVRDDDGTGHFDFLIGGEAAKPTFQLDAGTMMGQGGGSGPPGTAGTLPEEIF